MSITYSFITCNAILTRIIELIDAGSVRPNAYMEIFTAPRPNTADDPVTTQTKLATLQLGNPSFNSPQNGVAIAKAIAADTAAAASGPAAWFRIYNLNGVAVCDGLVTDTSTGTGNIVFDSVDVVSGGTVGITNLTLNAPRTIV
jgi:hypothetical protein